MSGLRRKKLNRSIIKILKKFTKAQRKIADRKLDFILVDEDLFFEFPNLDINFLF